jgi:ATP-binding cassette subfamily B multidrug efflux pump
VTQPTEAEAAAKDFDAQLFRRLLGQVRPYWRVTLVALVSLLAFALIDTVMINLLRRAVDESLAPVGRFAALSPAARYDNLVRIALLFAGLGVVSFGLRYLQGYLLALLSQRVVRDLRRQLFTKFQRLSVGYFDQNPVGRLMTRVTSDVDAINQFLTQGLVGIVQDVFLILIFAGALLLYHLEVGLVALSVLPVMLFVTSYLRVRLRDTFRRARAYQSIVNTNLNENLSGMTTIQLFNREARNHQLFGRLNDQLLAANVEAIRWFSFFYPLVGLIAELGVALTLWYGGLRTFAEGSGLTIGTLVAMLELLRRLFVPLQELADKFNILQAAFASAERIYGVFDEPETVLDKRSAKPVTHFRGEVEFKGVWFSYLPPGETPTDKDWADEDWVLRGIDLRVRPGESVALVGATGAGKTSVISLLSRFYDVQRGRVLLDGVDVRDYKQHELRRHVGVVLQDVFLFAGTVASNLTLGDETVTRSRMEEVCRFVGAHDFIATLPHGYDTEVRERGATLSTGQKQLLAFARALIQNPDIVLVLDEATANVDTETELKLQAALAKLMQGRTSLIIAHRLSTIEHCDRIVVMRRGRILETGSHRELLAEGGYYARLYEAQYGEAVTL